MAKKVFNSRLSILSITCLMGIRLLAPLSSSSFRCSRSAPLLVLLAVRRGDAVLVLAPVVPCVSFSVSPCLSNGGAMDADRSSCSPFRRSPVLVLVPRAGALRGANAVSSHVPCLLVDGRGGVCVGVVNCHIHIYGLLVSWYSLGVEREQANERNSRNDEQD